MCMGTDSDFDWGVVKCVVGTEPYDTVLSGSLFSFFAAAASFLRKWSVTLSSASWTACCFATTEARSCVFSFSTC